MEVAEICDVESIFLLSIEISLLYSGFTKLLKLKVEEMENECN